jgi:hypothetical protein
MGRVLLRAYVRAGKKQETIALVTEQVRSAREELPGGSPRLGVVLVNAGTSLLNVKAYAEAEPLLRESLAIREKQGADSWETHHARSQLGAALLGQGKHADAEPLLVAAYQGMKRAATNPKQTLERLVLLYGAWGKPGEAARWRKTLQDERERQQG